MSRTISIPEELFERVVELARKQQVSPERIVSAALAEQLAGWSRMEDMASRASRDRFIAALDRVPDVEPIAEDRSE